MKAKRIVSILLTGSMLLSLLPVSALAAAPVFDAPAQTTAKKAAPLVQEADASRSTEEEAATRSSRDLDAENGTADSITIQLNAEGKPADSDDLEHWVHSGVTSYDLKLYQGIFTLQPSSEAGAESALQDTLYIYKDAEFNSGTVGSTTFNNGTISGGTFKEAVEVYADSKPAGIEGGTFEKGMKLENFGFSITIKDGLFDGEVSAAEGYSGMLSINGGYFVNKPSLPVGSDTRFTTVSDQDGRAFQVPVNKGWSEGYETLYVPSGSPAQPNTITVKTAAPLTDCLAGDVSIMGTDKVQLNNDGSYTIEVY